MALIPLPQRRLGIKQIQIPRQQIPISEIIRVKGQTPIAPAIETVGKVIGKALEQRALLRRQGEQLAAMERLGGLEAGELEGLTPEQALPFLKASTKARGGITESFTPRQLKAVAAGDFGEMEEVFPEGVPKGLATQAIIGSRDTVVTDRFGRKMLLDRTTNTLTPISGKEAGGKRRIGVRNFTPVDQKRVITERDRFHKDKVIQELDQRVGKVNEVGDLIQQNPANAYGIVAGALTRLAGEVGRLTDEDIDRNIKPKALASRVKQTLKLAKDGKFPESRLGEMSIILDIVNKAALKTYDQKLDNFVDSTMLILPKGADRNEVRQFIGGRSILYKPISGVDVTGDVGGRKKTRVGRFTIEIED